MLIKSISTEVGWSDGPHAGERRGRPAARGEGDHPVRLREPGAPGVPPGTHRTAEPVRDGRGRAAGTPVPPGQGRRDPHGHHHHQHHPADRRGTGLPGSSGHRPGHQIDLRGGCRVAVGHRARPGGGRSRRNRLAHPITGGGGRCLATGADGASPGHRPQRQHPVGGGDGRRARSPPRRPSARSGHPHRTPGGGIDGGHGGGTRARRHSATREPSARRRRRRRRRVDCRRLARQPVWCWTAAASHRTPSPSG